MPVAPLPVAHGSIGAPESAVPAITEVAQRIADHPDSFLLPWNGSAFPSACIDGRSSADEASVGAVAPELRLAGGTLSVWVGAVLSGMLPTPGDVEAAAASLRDFCADLHRRGFPLATHTDDHAAGANCGCGAADHLGSVLSLFVSEHHAIAQLLTGWGMSIFAPDADLSSACSLGFAAGTSEACADDALQTTSSPRGVPEEEPHRYQPFFVSLVNQAHRLSGMTTGIGKQLNTAIRFHDESANAQLLGLHQEVLAVINTHTQTCVDRSALTTELATISLGDNDGADAQKTEPQAFVVDLWTLPAVASALGLEGSQRKAFITAVAAFNAAALIALSAPRMVVCAV